MSVLCFTVPGACVSKQRPRVTSKGTFMPAHYRAFRRLVAAHATAAIEAATRAGIHWDTAAPGYQVHVRVFQPTRRNIDGDNALGAILDSLNQVAFADDGLVKRATVEKAYDKANPRTEVRVEELTAAGITRVEAEMCERWADAIGA